MAAKRTILVVDDDADMLDTLRLFLEKRGFDVLTASQPEEGFELAERMAPDLIILDIMMPEGTEGFHWVWRLRRHPDERLKQTPIIALSSIHGTVKARFGEGDSDETGDYLPIQGFLDKPVNPDLLAEKITSVLS